MSPRAQRTAPPYQQITDYYRQLILSGGLSEGEKLPTIVEVAREWEVATATAAKGIGQLTVEGFVRTSPRGTFVAAAKNVTSTPRDRLVRMHRSGRATGSGGESVLVTAAEQVTPPAYVADLLDLDSNEPIVRREWITSTTQTPGSPQPLMLSVSWFRVAFADKVPELLDTQPASGEEIVRRIEVATGRKVSHAQDHFRGRAADEREAKALGLPVGSAILAGAFLRNDETGVIEYGEFVLPPNMTISYEYDLDTPPGNTSETKDIRQDD